MNSAARDLLFGLAALRVGFIDQDQLVAALQARANDKTGSLAEHLENRGVLDTQQCGNVEELITLHLTKYGGDIEQSLAAISPGASTLAKLAELGDGQLNATLTHIGSARTEPDDRQTAAHLVGTATADGRRFRVLRPHAQGGLGAVFVALDEELHREVALKQILEHHADDSVARQRFLLEAEITGGLEHPGIVPVYGLGHHRDGRPYYAMRFIKGDSLKEAIAAFHADEGLKADAGARTLARQKLLRRFLDVCNAIDYAHGRGVLHRDLKPANIIVGRYGETLVVDWGLAKAVGIADPAMDKDHHPLIPASASGSAKTLPGSALGTPAYMSPEQASGEIDRLGPHSDVYSLGATLYCLLTGQAPFVSRDLVAAMEAVTKGDFPTPRSLDATIPVALEAVCLKAMSTKPEDRYASPRALADDIERWIADAPVTAYRETVWERLARWSRTHRTLVRAAAASLVVALIAAALIAIQQARAADRERKVALSEREARKAERAARIAEQKALAVARTRLTQIERANDLLASIFQDIDPRLEEKDGKPLGAQLGERLDLAAAQLDAASINDPLTLAKLQSTLGRTQLSLDRPDKAIVLLASAGDALAKLLGPDDADTLTTRNNLSRAYQAAGRTKEALSLSQDVLALRIPKLGPDHKDTLVSKNTVASSLLAVGRTDEAIALLEETLKVRTATLGAEQPDTLNARNNLATAYSVAGRMAQAISHLEETLKVRLATLGSDHVDTHATRTNLSTAYLKAGRYREAIPLLEQSLTRFTAKLGPDHNDTHATRNNLASTYEHAGRGADAILLHKETLKLRTAKFGKDHPSTLASRNNLGTAYASAGSLDEAISLHEESVALSLAKFGPNHPTTLVLRNNLGDAYRAAGRTAEAIKIAEDVLALRIAKLGPDHPDTLGSCNNLAQGYFNSDRLTEAIAQWEGMLKALDAKLGPDHPNALVVRSNLASAYLRAGRVAEAIPIFEKTLKFAEAKLGPTHRLTLNVHDHLASAYYAGARWSDSEPMYLSSIERHRRAGPSALPGLTSDLAALGYVLIKQSKWAEAEPTLRECLAIRDKSSPDDWSRFLTMSLLGNALLGQAKYPEAEPLLVGGYEGIKGRESKIPLSSRRLLPEAAERIIRLYETWGRPDQLNSWKSRLGLADLPANAFARP
jgi:eukaryotic-like serine/threonine-protein kinase